MRGVTAFQQTAGPVHVLLQQAARDHFEASAADNKVALCALSKQALASLVSSAAVMVSPGAALR
jgi:hypothetical protein